MVVSDGLKKRRTVMGKEIPTTVSVKLTEDEIWWIVNECEYGHKAIGDWDDTCLHLAKKLQGRLEARGLEQSHPFGRKKTKEDIDAEKSDARWMKMIERLGA